MIPVGKSGQFEAVSYGLRAARNLCDREAAAQGTKFNPFPQKLILYFRGRASRLIRRVLYAFFRRQNQFHLRRDQAFMKDNVQPTLRAEIWRHFSLYFAA